MNNGTSVLPTWLWLTALVIGLVFAGWRFLYYRRLRKEGRKPDGSLNEPPVENDNDQTH